MGRGAERKVCARSFMQNGVELGGFEARPALIAISAGTTTNLEVGTDTLPPQSPPGQYSYSCRLVAKDQEGRFMEGHLPTSSERGLAAVGKRGVNFDSATPHAASRA